MSKTLVLGAAALALSAGAASAQAVYPGYGYAPYGYGYGTYGYGYAATAPLYDYAAPAYGYGTVAPATGGSTVIIVTPGESGTCTAHRGQALKVAQAVVRRAHRQNTAEVDSLSRENPSLQLSATTAELIRSRIFGNPQLLGAVLDRLTKKTA